MKISELIDILTTIKENNGDLVIYVDRDVSNSELMQDEISIESEYHELPKHVQM